ncbi:unnamed protein product [Paramecium pentaurelia]|uniref:Uncharacterized protein n=1 Tax=Paramecium pentaurelia TaxID=43138 RepID=A0A8S1WKZ5_9CILI|nr:unnamed protein product [Paramecium pentaurelia]
MLKEEAIKKECIKNDHKGFQIVAVDLSDELIKKSDQEKYYCVKCLIEKIGNKKIILFEEALKMIEIFNQELKKQQADKQKETRESIQKLQDLIKLIEGSLKKQFDDLQKQLEIQIDQEQNTLDQISEPKISNDQSKSLSTCYKEDDRLASPSSNKDYKEINESLIQIRKLLQQLEQVQDVDKEIQKIEQTCSINLEVDEKYKKTSAFNFT